MVDEYCSFYATVTSRGTTRDMEQAVKAYADVDGQEMSSGQLSEKERAILCELYIKNFNSKTDAVSIRNEYRNFYKIRKEKLPENMPVLLTMSEREDSEWLYINDFGIGGCCTM